MDLDGLQGEVWPDERIEMYGRAMRNNRRLPVRLTIALAFTFAGVFGCFVWFLIAQSGESVMALLCLVFAFMWPMFSTLDHVKRSDEQFLRAFPRYERQLRLRSLKKQHECDAHAKRRAQASLDKYVPKESQD